MPLTLAEQPVEEADVGSSTSSLPQPSEPAVPTPAVVPVAATTAATPEAADGGGFMIGKTMTTTSTTTTTRDAPRALPKQSDQLVHIDGGGVVEESDRGRPDQGTALLVGVAGGEELDEVGDSGGGGGGCQSSSAISSSAVLIRRRRRVTASRSRICGLLVERGARRTWRRDRSEAQVALDNKYRLLLEGDDGRNFCTFNG